MTRPAQPAAEAGHEAAAWPAGRQAVLVLSGPESAALAAPWSPARSGRPLGDPVAGAWPRWFARSFDTWWQAGLVALAAGHAIGSAWPAFLRWLDTPFGWKLFGLMCIPGGLLLDAVLQAVAGNTPGKALLGLRVLTPDGGRPCLRQLLGRNRRLWSAGLGFGLPAVILLTMARQALRLRSGRPASYDGGCFVVRAAPAGWCRKGVFGALFAMLFALVVALDAADRQDGRDMAAAQPAPRHAWTNPATGRTVDIAAQWQAAVRIDDEDRPYYLFTEPGRRAVVLIAFDEQGGTLLPRYTRALMDKLADDVVLPGRRFEQFRERPSWVAKGERRDGAMEVGLRVVTVRGRAWRVMAMQAPPLAATDDLVRDLSAALWDSVTQHGQAASGVHTLEARHEPERMTRARAGKP